MITNEEAIEVLQKNYPDSCYSMLREAVDIAIAALKTQKIGKWIILKDEYDDVVEAVCSCCDRNGNHKWAFCPNCGARME